MLDASVCITAWQVSDYNRPQATTCHEEG